MVSSALGIRVKLSQEQKEREMKELEDAKGKQTTSIWLCGTYTHSLPSREKTLTEVLKTTSF